MSVSEVSAHTDVKTLRTFIEMQRANLVDEQRKVSGLEHQLEIARCMADDARAARKEAETTISQMREQVFRSQDQVNRIQADVQRGTSKRLKLLREQLTEKEGELEEIHGVLVAARAKSHKLVERERVLSERLKEREEQCGQFFNERAAYEKDYAILEDKLRAAEVALQIHAKTIAGLRARKWWKPWVYRVKSGSEKSE
jgi:chromosome segregation ATPase